MMTPKQRYDERQRLKREKQMAQDSAFERREKEEAELNEIAVLGLKFVRAFLEGKAEVYVHRFDDGSLGIRLRQDA